MSGFIFMLSVNINMIDPLSPFTPPINKSLVRVRLTNGQIVISISVACLSALQWHFGHSQMFNFNGHGFKNNPEPPHRLHPYIPNGVLSLDLTRGPTVAPVV